MVAAGPTLIRGLHDYVRTVDSPIRLLDKPKACEHGHVTIGYYGGWSVEIHVMLMLGEGCCNGMPFYSWCYPKNGSAHLAAFLWDPEESGEPVGYKKAASVAYDRPRMPGERAPWWHPPMA